MRMWVKMAFSKCIFFCTLIPTITCFQILYVPSPRVAHQLLGGARRYKTFLDTNLGKNDSFCFRHHATNVFRIAVLLSPRFFQHMLYLLSTVALVNMSCSVYRLFKLWHLKQFISRRNETMRNYSPKSHFLISPNRCGSCRVHWVLR